MKQLTSSVYTFEKLIRGNFLYVDKTEFIWELVRPATGLYFLSRPRRFGKSLTLSTLKAVFEGRRELFEGLAIGDKQTYDWKPYPVIHLDLNGLDFSTPEEMETSLRNLLQEQADSHGVHLAPSSAILMFRDLIHTLAGQGQQVVVLVDEYDKPILGNLDPDDPSRAQAILAKLRPFYSVIKACEHLERFVLVTGVSKFSHVSMF
ncbi:MAG: AAA family ATPase, partial [Oligosphaeraceae bacterium]